MGLFDDLVAQKDAPKGLFGDLVPARDEAPKSAFAQGVRQLGLTARYAVEGLPQIADTLLTPARLAVNAVSGAFGGPKARTLSEEGTRLADAAGLPSPATPTERTIADATRTGFGAAGGAGLASRAAGAVAGPTSRAVLGKLAEAPSMQVISGSAAGGAAGAVREADGSPLGQALAATAAGVAAPLAAGQAMKAGAALGDAAKAYAAKRIAPEKLDIVLRSELQRAGINWDEIGAQAKQQLRQDAEKAVYSGQPISADALGRLADYRRIGATPLLGDITQDPRILTLQRNLTKQLANVSNSVASDSLPELANQNAKKVLGTLEGVAKSPLDAYATGKGLIAKVVGKDEGMRASENAMYEAARNAAGRDIPLERSAFVNKAFENLAASNKMAFLPGEIGDMLNQISQGQIARNGQVYDVPFNVNSIDALKTMLATASRGSKDGNTRAAIRAVRDALEEVQPAPIKRQFGGNQVVNGATAQNMREQDPAAAEALKWFDAARGQARQRRNWQESAAFIEDALGGATPDKFVQKHVISAPVEELAKLRREIGPENADLYNAVRKQLIDYILKRGRADSDVTTFTGAGLKDGLEAVGRRKLELFFSPEEIGQIESAVRVGRYMQSQPIGSAVNNSNTAAMMAGKFADLIAKGSNVPFVQLVTDPLRNLTLRASAIPLRDLNSGLTVAQPRQASGGAGSAVIPLAALLTAPSVNAREDDSGK